jgi:tetratricopeptide (TPR) repeat protein
MEAATANPQPLGMRFQLVRARGGDGKTTFLIRLAYELAQAGYAVLLNRNSTHIDHRSLRDACNMAAMIGKGRQKSVYLLIDNVFPTHRNLLQSLHNNALPNLAVIATSRFDAIPDDAPKFRRSLLEQPVVDLDHLTSAETNELIDKLQRYGLLSAADIQPILDAATRGDQRLLSVVLALTHGGDLKEYVTKRLTIMNGGKKLTDQRRTQRRLGVRLYEAIARNHAWGLDTPVELLPALSELESHQVRLSPDDPWTREYLRSTRDGHWRTEHELVARAAVAYLDGMDDDPIAHLKTTLTALASLTRDTIRAPIAANFVGRLVLRATQGTVPSDIPTTSSQTSISASATVASQTASPAILLSRLRDALPPKLITRFDAWATPSELVDFYTPAYISLEYWSEAAAAADRAVAQLTHSPDQQDLARLQRARSLQQLGESRAALTELNALLTTKPEDVEALWQRALAYASLDDLTRALADFEMALALRPQDPDILHDRATFYWEQDRHAEAMADLESAFAARGNEDDPDLLNARGLVFAGMGEVEKAMADYNRALELRPDDPDILCNRASLYFNTDDFDQALADYNTALSLSRDDPYILFSRGNVYHRLGRYASALGDYNAALASAPDDVLTLLARAEIYAQLGHFAAFNDLGRAESLEPSNTEIQTLRRRFEASRLWALGEYNTPLQSDPDDLEALFHRADKCFTLAWYLEALADLNRLNLLLPNEYAILATRGSTYQKMSRYKDALEDFNRSLQLNPDDPVTLANRGATYQKMGRYEDALEDFNRSLELDPDNLGALKDRGIMYGSVGRYEDALEDFNRSLELDPDYLINLYNRGTTYQKMGRYEDALEDFNRSLELDPDDPITLAERGLAYHGLGRYEDALEDLNHSLELDPDDPLTLSNRGITYQKMGRYEDALEDLNRSLVLNPASPIPPINRGNTYANMGRYEDALEDFNRSLELDPANPLALTNRGSTYANMGRYEDALEDLNRSLELNPDNPHALTYRGVVYITMGRDKDARADFDRSLELDPTLAATSEARKRLLAQKPPPGKTWDQETLG